MEEARQSLEKLASKGFAEMRIKTSGQIIFAFPEFIKDNSTDFEDI